MDPYFSFVTYIFQLLTGSLLTGINFASGGIPGGGSATTVIDESGHGIYSQGQAHVPGNYQAMNTVILMMILPMIPSFAKASIQWAYRKIEAVLDDWYKVSLLIKEEEDIFYNVNRYVSKKQEETMLWSMRHVECVVKRTGSQYNYHYDDDTPRPELALMPLPGMVQIQHGKHKIWVERLNSNRGAQGFDFSTTLFTLADSFLSSNNALKISMRETDILVLKDIVQQWVDHIHFEDIKKLTVYQCMRNHGDYEWTRTASREMRTFDSVVLKKGQREEILHDVERFLGASKKYEMRGIPYRHAVILYGPPGTGKTSCIKGLAQSLKKNIAHISLAVSMDDEQFMSMLSSVPMNSIIVMEDFDRSHIMAKKAGSAETQHENAPAGAARITEAGLLNALDGIGTPDGTLFFLTCNDTSKLGDAVKRPGRIDQIYLISYADEYQIEEMFWRFFGEGSATIDPSARSGYKELQETAREFVRHIQNIASEITTAVLQKFFLEFEKDNEARNGELNTALLRDFEFVKDLYDKIMVATIEETMVKNEAMDEAKRLKELESGEKNDTTGESSSSSTAKADVDKNSGDDVKETNGHGKDMNGQPEKTNGNTEDINNNTREGKQM